MEGATRIVTQNSLIYIDLKGEKPRVEASKSMFDDYLRRSMVEQIFKGASAYQYGNDLVFVEQKNSRDTIGFLKYYLERVIDDVELVSFLVDKEKICRYGRQVPHYPSSPMIDYPIAVKGKNGIEIWLNSHLFNNQRLEEQSIVNQVLEVVNFPLLDREYTMLDKVKQALSGEPLEKSISISVEEGILNITQI